MTDTPPAPRASRLRRLFGALARLIDGHRLVLKRLNAMERDANLRFDAVNLKLDVAEQATASAWTAAEALAASRAEADADRFGRLEARLDALSRQVSQSEVNAIERAREARMLLGALSLPPTHVWRNRLEGRTGEPGDQVFSRSELCRQDSFEQPYFSYWTAQLNQVPHYHRKLWEFVFICQALWERGMIRPGARGLGFGVGGEPLTAYFASRGCFITATDMAAEAAAAAGWTDTAQHAAGKQALRLPWICPDDVFERQVEFRTCDMNAIPDDLTGYDFCWSACALEHLGSIENGLTFIQRSMDCLAPNGVAVHTTEFNLSSNADTLDHAGTVIFRQRDLEALGERLQRSGFTMAPLNLDPGSGELDRYIDVAPYRDDPHLRLALAGYSATSVGMIIRKG